MKNYYQILSLDPNCSMEEVKSAYKKYAMEFHPDKHNGSSFFQERFIEVKEAYDVLINYQQRRAHDDYHSLNQNRTTHVETEQEPNDPLKQHTGNKANNQSNQTPTFEHYIDWAIKRYNNGDFYGALEEIEKAQKLEPKNGLPIYYKAQFCESSNDLLSANRFYKRAFKMGYLAAKDDMIRLDSLREDAKRGMLPFLYYSQLGVAVAFILYFILRTSMPPLEAGIIAEIVGLIIGIIIVRRAKNKVPQPLLNMLNTEWDIQLAILLWVLGLMGGFPLIMYFINS